MNWFLIFNGVLLLGGAMTEFIHATGSWKMGMVYLCWSIPSFLLGWVR